LTKIQETSRFYKTQNKLPSVKALNQQLCSGRSLCQIW